MNTQSSASSLASDGSTPPSALSIRASAHLPHDVLLQSASASASASARRPLQIRNARRRRTQRYLRDPLPSASVCFSFSFSPISSTSPVLATTKSYVAYPYPLLIATIQVGVVDDDVRVGFGARRWRLLS
ncbi:hypothetical protein DL767_001209 [Monosporascus sp. MG133]|nr:hypothetical protein DL767_001209 [Monosporascus sp. MG133]